MKEGHDPILGESIIDCYKLIGAGNNDQVAIVNLDSHAATRSNINNTQNKHSSF